MKLYELISSVLNVPVDILTEESGPNNTEEWDSLAHISIVAAVEQNYNVHLTMPEILLIKTISDLRGILVNQGVKFSVL